MAIAFLYDQYIGLSLSLSHHISYTLHSIPKAVVCAQTRIISSATPYPAKYSPVSSFSFLRFFQSLQLLEQTSKYESFYVVSAQTLSRRLILQDQFRALQQALRALPVILASPGVFPVTSDAALAACPPVPSCLSELLRHYTYCLFCSKCPLFLFPGNLLPIQMVMCLKIFLE